MEQPTIVSVIAAGFIFFAIGMITLSATILLPQLAAEREEVRRDTHIWLSSQPPSRR